VVLVIPNVLVMLAGVKTRNRLSSLWATIGCVLAMLPLSLAWPLSLPIGLWALAILTRADARAAFAAAEASRSGTSGGTGVSQAAPHGLESNNDRPDSGAAPLLGQDAGATGSRFSRKSIIGAVWSAFGFACLVALIGVDSRETIRRGGAYEGGVEERYDESTGTVIHVPFVKEISPPSPGPTEPPGPAWWQWLLILTVLPLGVSAPFGTTILGVIAINDIRRSRGHVTGLGLALADALLFPLLAVDALIVFASYNAGGDRWGPLLSLTICAAVDGLIVWWACRAALAAREASPTRIGAPGVSPPSVERKT
jgi:hypothetical protein